MNETAVKPDQRPDQRRQRVSERDVLTAPAVVPWVDAVDRVIRLTGQDGDAAADRAAVRGTREMKTPLLTSGHLQRLTVRQTVDGVVWHHPRTTVTDEVDSLGNDGVRLDEGVGV